MHLFLFKRTVTTSFGLVWYQKTFWRNKSENDKPNQTRSYRRFWLQSGFLQKGVIWQFFPISKFSKRDIFVIFGFPSKSFFFWTTKLLLFHQKIFGFAAQKFAKILTCVGGVKKRPYPPPPQKKMTDFARIVVVLFSQRSDFALTTCSILRIGTFYCPKQT